MPLTILTTIHSHGHGDPTACRLVSRAVFYAIYEEILQQIRSSLFHSKYECARATSIRLMLKKLFYLLPPQHYLSSFSAGHLCEPVTTQFFAIISCILAGPALVAPALNSVADPDSIWLLLGSRASRSRSRCDPNCGGNSSAVNHFVPAA